LANHNAYVVIRASIDANQAAFGGGFLPQKIADLVGGIAELFAREDWASYLETEGSTLVAGRAKQPSTP